MSDKPFKTNAIMQEALIKAGLLDEERAKRVNIILKEEKRKDKQRKRKEREKQATEAKARWNRSKKAAA